MTRLSLLTVLAALATPQGSASADSLFFTDDTQSTPSVIYRANTDGTGLQEIYSAEQGGNGGISNLFVDDRRQQLYWYENSIGLRRSNLDGSGVETVGSITSNQNALAIDSLRGHIYGVQTTSGLGTDQFIVRYDLDGTNATTILGGLDYVSAIGVDEANGTLYFGDVADPSDIFGSGRVRSANLDGTGVQTLLGDLITASFLEVDPSLGFLYVGRGGFEVLRTNLDGTGQLTIPAFYDLAIDPTGALYGLTDITISSLVRADLDGSNLTQIPGLGDFRSFNIAFASTVVPEPSSLALAGTGVAALIAFGRRRAARPRAIAAD